MGLHMQKSAYKGEINMPNCPHCGSKYVERRSSDTEHKHFVLYYCSGCKKEFKIKKLLATREWLMTLYRDQSYGSPPPDDYIEIYRTSTRKLYVNQKFSNNCSSGIATLKIWAEECWGRFYVNASTYQNRFYRGMLGIGKIKMNSELTRQAKNVEVMKAIWDDGSGCFDLTRKFSEIVNREVCDYLISAIGAGASKDSGGCYVATAVYGSYNCPEVWTLRRFRDFTLAESWYGRAFIRAYYAISPTLVKWFGNTAWFKNIWKPALDRMVKQLNASGVENTPYTDKTW